MGMISEMEKFEKDTGIIKATFQTLKEEGCKSMQIYMDNVDMADVTELTKRMIINGAEKMEIPVSIYLMMIVKELKEDITE